jgi:hypothetical protein
MTPKEKADKLCIDFLMKPNNTDIRFGMDKQLAKQCALIAVDEIIASNPIAFDEDDNCIAKQWWQEVKTEIELL